MADQVLIRLDKATFRLYDREIFPGTTLKIIRGNHLAIIGGNATGKTIFGRAIAGNFPVIAGQVIYHIPADKISFVSFQSGLLLRNAVIPYMQQRWNTFDTDAAPQVRDFFWPDKKIDKKTYHLLREFNASHLLDRKSIHLSNGELRKVELVRALSTNPEVLIIDNAYVGLDHHSRTILKETLEQVSETVNIILLTLNDKHLPAFIRDKLYCKDLEIYNRLPARTGHRANGTLPVDIVKHDYHLPETLVKLTDVNIAYGKVKILRSINWEINQGEHWALIGPNGSGKSTLLSLLAADNPQAYSQTIYLFGIQRGSGESIWDIKRKIAFISPELHQFSPRHHTLKEVLIDDIAWIYPGIDRQPLTQKAVTWFSWLNVDLDLQQRFGTLSSGEQRLVLFVRILLYPFSLLIADEPCQGLSEENIQKVRSVFQYLAENTRVSTIFVTHNPAEIPVTTNRVFDLQKENKVISGSKK